MVFGIDAEIKSLSPQDWARLREMIRVKRVNPTDNTHGPQWQIEHMPSKKEDSRGDRTKDDSRHNVSEGGDVFERTGPVEVDDGYSHLAKKARRKESPDSRDIADLKRQYAEFTLMLQAVTSSRGGVSEHTELFNKADSVLMSVTSKLKIEIERRGEQVPDNPREYLDSLPKDVPKR